jgi:hypothetical protein
MISSMHMWSFAYETTTIDVDIRCFLKLDDLMRNPLPNVLVTYKLHGDIDDSNE